MNENSEEFFEYMVNSFPDEVEDLVDAIYVGRTIVPLVKQGLYFGAIGPHVFYSDDVESRWFANTTVDEAAMTLAAELV